MNPQAEINLGPVLRRAEELVRGGAAKAGVVLRVRPIDAPLRMPADALLEVLASVLANAVMATPAGGTVSVDAQVIGADVLVWFRDEGAGVTAASARARAVVEQHGGSLWAESMPPLGTATVMRLPLSAPLLSA